MILEENLTLSNGVDIPKLGLGTWFINMEHIKDYGEASIFPVYR